MAPCAALGFPDGGSCGPCEDSTVGIDEEVVAASLALFFLLGSNSLALEMPGVVLGSAPPGGGVLVLEAGPRMGEMDDWRFFPLLTGVTEVELSWIGLRFD